MELVKYANGSEAARELAAYILCGLIASLRADNTERRHSALGYVSPAEFERHLAVLKSENALSAQTEAPQCAMFRRGFEKACRRPR